MQEVTRRPLLGEFGCGGIRRPESPWPQIGRFITRLDLGAPASLQLTCAAGLPLLRFPRSP